MVYTVHCMLCVFYHSWGEKGRLESNTCERKEEGRGLGRELSDGDTDLRSRSGQEQLGAKFVPQQGLTSSALVTMTLTTKALLSHCCWAARRSAGP